ncbi:MAG: hypothetical protein KF760_06720 [Candidatus Eremiobacteraeota bacterium]|nr:hypothetical protein [Candidatus Eremiobacteraeota bacterium]MCW5866049.1 hypothetical protein [Candidatus Eremiobacteraeota bacterium]
MRKVSSRQLKVLQFLNDYTRLYHCPPSYREIAHHFGWASPQASLGHLRALARKHCVTPILGANGTARGYRLTSEGEQLLHSLSA